MNDVEMQSYLNSLSQEEYEMARRVLDMGGNLALVHVAVTLSRRIDNVSRPPWAGWGHAAGGFVGGALAAFFGLHGGGR